MLCDNRSRTDQCTSRLIIYISRISHGAYPQASWGIHRPVTRFTDASVNDARRLHDRCVNKIIGDGRTTSVTVAKIVQNKMPHSATPMVITATVAPPCGRGGLDTFAYSMYCEWQVYKAVFFQTYDIYQCNYVVLTC